MTDAPVAIANAPLDPAFAEPTPGLVCAFLFRPGCPAEELPTDRPLPDRPAGWLWLHFNLADARACQFLRSASLLPAPALEVLISPGEHQQLNVRDGCLYGILADLVCGLDGVTEDLALLHFALTEAIVITCRRRTLSGVEATRKALRGGLQVPTPAALLETILEHAADAIDELIDKYSNTLDRIEERILADEIDQGRPIISRVRRNSVRLHRQIAILRAVIQRFEPDLCPAPSLRPSTVKLGQRLGWLDQEIVALRDRAQLLQEEISIKTGEQTNRNLHVLAIVTTIFLPASLIAGILGMNVGGLPLVSDPSGFLWSMIILAGATGVVLWLLKRSGVLRRR
jgi:zinc transporter